MLAIRTDNCVEQRGVVDMVIIKFHVIDPNNYIFRNVYFSRVAENGKAIYFYYPSIPGNIEQNSTTFSKLDDSLNYKNNVPIDNSYPEGVMVMKMARKIKALEGVFGLIQLTASNPNVKFTNNFFKKGQCDGNFTLHATVVEHKITNIIEVFGDQKTAWGGGCC